MKRIILFICIAISFLSANAQKVTLPTMGDGVTYFYSPTDYSFTNSVGRYFTLTTAVAHPATQDFVIKLEKVSGTHTNVAVTLYGFKSLIKNDSTIIGSVVNWKGTSADTVIAISNATANRYKGYKWKVVGAGTAVSNIADQELKLRNE